MEEEEIRIKGKIFRWHKGGMKKKTTSGIRNSLCWFVQWKPDSGRNEQYINQVTLSTGTTQSAPQTEGDFKFMSIKVTDRLWEIVWD